MVNFLRILLSFCLIAISRSAPTNITDLQSKDVLNYRLPTNVIPHHYVVELTPYFTTQNGNKEQFTFDGKVDITLSTNESDITQIVLHANELEISAIVKLRDEIVPLTEIKLVSRSQDVRTHKYILEFEKALQARRKYVLSLQFVGKLSTDMHGFYRSSYEENGVTKWLATTQMQATHARRVFPCFDEPSFKATFVVKINRPSHFQPTISNTKLESSDPNAGPDLVRDTFRKTPLMSTYLLAFIVSEFTVRENVQKTFSVYARPKAHPQTEYSFEWGQKMLAKFDEYLDYKYSSVPEMTKMSMAALPDFSAGAMENWGLLTYREALLLYDPEVVTALAQQRIAAVVAHEQAHMWFGDLVTCDWWKYAWLNEGFARYFQYFGTAMVEPTWDLPLQFIVEQIHTAFGTDSLESTHPLTHDVNTPSEVSGIFDSISYNKGASVIRMTEHMIGSEKFRDALRDYLKQNAFKTSLPEKLYSALQKQTGDNFNIATILDTWTTQSGYPVVTVDVQADRKTLHIHQKRFLLQNKNHNDDTQWEIPLNYATQADNSNFNSTHPLFILSRKSGSNSVLTVELKYEVEWIVFNVQQTGFYRVNYDELTWTQIEKALKKKHSDIHVANRAQIVDDSFSLARAGLLNYTRALKTIQYLEKETHYLPWFRAIANLEQIKYLIPNEDLKLYKDYVLSLLDNVYNHLGFQPKSSDSRLDTYNRVEVLTQACLLGHKECIEKSKEEFTKIQTTTHKVPVNIVPAVYCTAIAEGKEDEWNYLWDKYKTENVAGAKVVLLRALGCTRNEKVLHQYLDKIRTDEVRLQDKASALSSTLYHPENIERVLQYFLTNHQNLTATIGGASEVASVLGTIARRLANREKLNTLSEFVTKNSEYSSVTKALKDADFNVKWANENVPVIRNYIKSLRPPDNSKDSATGLAASSFLIIIASAVYFYL